MPTAATHAVPSRPTMTESARLRTFWLAMPPITGSACFMTISTRSWATPKTPSVMPRTRSRFERNASVSEAADDADGDVDGCDPGDGDGSSSSPSPSAVTGTDAAARATMPRRCVRATTEERRGPGVDARAHSWARLATGRGPRGTNENPTTSCAPARDGDERRGATRGDALGDATRGTAAVKSDIEGIARGRGCDA